VEPVPEPAPPPPFERIVTSPFATPPAPRFRSLADLIFGGAPGEADDVPVIMGCHEGGALDVTLRQLRHAALDLADDLAARGLRPGDTVALVRLPRTSEALCAAVYAALTAAGIRVLLPMYLETDRFAGWLRAAGARAVVWSRVEVQDLGRNEADQRLLAGLEAAARDAGLPCYCLVGDLQALDRCARARAASPATDDPRVARCLERGGPERECLLLTTSGTSGRAKLVRYREGALLRTCAAWEAAGLFRPELQGGRGLCLLFAHSMGVRAFWNALWTRQPILLVTPEWFLERPERVRALLLTMRPQHVTGGPAVYRALLELARVFPELKETCLRDLRTAVSLGAPFDADTAGKFAVAVGASLANAFGTTETMQVTTTLVGERAGRAPQWLGEPLPGVRIGLERAEAGGDVFRMHVSSPFACAGYLAAGGEEETALGEWIATGDLLADGADGLRFVGREGRDFVKDGFGVKVPLVRVAAWYAGLGAPLASAADGLRPAASGAGGSGNPVGVPGLIASEPDGLGPAGSIAGGTGNPVRVPSLIEHVECFPLREEPGLAALVFLRPDVPGVSRSPLAVTRRVVLDRVESLLEARTEDLRSEVEEFEFRHLTVARFACVATDVPRTGKGVCDRLAVQHAHRHLLDQLCGPALKRPGLVHLERERFAATRYVRLTSPRRGELMRLLKLDKHYERGAGDRLFHRERGREVAVWDFVGGFGANLLGHRHPDVVQAAADFVAGEGVFLHDQGSARLHEGELAHALGRAVTRHAGGHAVVRLGSTGAEAVEMALAHAFLEREERFRALCREQRQLFGATHPQRVAAILAHDEALLRGATPKVLALRGSFHGHTLGARAALSGQKTRGPFQPMMGVEAVFLPPDGSGDLGAILERETIPLTILCREGHQVVPGTVRFSRIVAALAEPIQGEGGVTEVSRELLRRLQGHDFPLIVDEIQAGLGRSGEFLASAGVAGDYYLFSKALGGGVAKIAAVLIDRRRYVERFDELYASTFAGDAFSCAVARRVLEVIERDDVPGRAHARGVALRDALEAVRVRHPEVIRAIRGRGLMLGIELETEGLEDDFVLRALADRELVGALASAWLLNRHDLRLLPTISAPDTLRVEPSAYVPDEAITALAAGLEAFCAAVEARDTAELLGFLVDDEQALEYEAEGEAPVPKLSARVEPAAPGAVRVAFINHFMLPERELVMVAPSLGRLSRTARRALFHRFVALSEMKPIVAFAQNLFGGRVHFTSVAITADAAMLETLHRSGERRKDAERIQDAVDRAGRLGCQVVALGGYTSILTADGTAVMPPAGVRVTSGNTFAVVVGARRVLRACAEAGIDPAAPGTRLAVVGATGNIGGGLLRRLVTAADGFRRVLLVGRAGARLDPLRDQILAERAGVEVTLATDMAALRDADVIAIATNTNEPIVFPHHLDPARRLIIADISVPSAVSAEVRRMAGVTIVAFAGAVTVPGAPGFVIASHTRPGTAFSCAAEAMLLALEPEATAGLQLVGPIEARCIELLDALGEKHGFFTTLGEGGFRLGAYHGAAR
jgi:acetylornithine/succinyldiaminopimelate/putrescine aminotransferase/predicted amino acid dehydrogenase/acyl-coenzyme A synthetase/AMP-(fatty) acid ligase